MSSNQSLCIFGEVLFDHFPDGNQVLGGAPFNVAWHLQAFGQSPCMVSRVGNDAEGERVRAAMVDWGLTTDYLQVDAARSTGRVVVTFKEGEPYYDIVPDCAYDHIEPVPLTNCQLLYHGSLAARADVSAETLRQLRASPPARIFIDVNLRPPWWQPALVHELLAGAGWVKLNVDELALLTGTQVNLDAAGEFLSRYGLQGLLLTHGAKGAELLLAGGDHFQVSPLSNIEVVDTVGAGDAFAAVMLLGLLQRWSMPLTLERAQQFAAAVVGRRGATVSERAFYETFLQQWHLAG